MTVSQSEEKSPEPYLIKKIREKAGHTQLSAATLIQVGRRTWQDWERGVYEMHPAYWAYFRTRAGIDLMEDSHADT